MTAKELIAQAKLNTKAPAAPSHLSPANLSEFLRFVLEQMLENIDYDADPRSNVAIAARMLAAIINTADELKGYQS